MARQPMKAINFSRGKELGGNVKIADDFWRRLKGLIGRTSLCSDEGLLITPCRGVHTFGLRFHIDVVYLDSEGIVIAVNQEVAPNRLLPVYFSASSVLELAAGRIAETATGPGDTIIIGRM